MTCENSSWQVVICGLSVAIIPGQIPLPTNGLPFANGLAGTGVNLAFCVSKEAHFVDSL
jgi:hypothetical protein